MTRQVPFIISEKYIAIYQFEDQTQSLVTKYNRTRTLIYLCYQKQEHKATTISLPEPLLKIQAIRLSEDVVPKQRNLP